MGKANELSSTLGVDQQNINSTSNSTCAILKCTCSLLESNSLSIEKELRPVINELHLELDALEFTINGKTSELDVLLRNYNDILKKERDNQTEIELVTKQNLFSNNELKRVEEEINKLKQIDSNPYTNLIANKLYKKREKQILIEQGIASLKILQDDLPLVAFWQKGFHKSGISVENQRGRVRLLILYARHEPRDRPIQGRRKHGRQYRQAVQQTHVQLRPDSRGRLPAHREAEVH